MQNWGFSIPPPQVNYPGKGDGPSWQGWTIGCGAVTSTTSRYLYDSGHPERKHTAPASRPISLTKYADANMVPGLVQHQHLHTTASQYGGQVMGDLAGIGPVNGRLGCI